jgi:hypothetical protein
MKHLLNKIFKLCLLGLIRLMNLQRIRLAKHLLDKNLNKVSRFGALLCYVYLFLRLGSSKCGSGPGLFGPLTGHVKYCRLQLR